MSASRRASGSHSSTSPAAICPRLSPGPTSGACGSWRQWHACIPMAVRTSSRFPTTRPRASPPRTPAGGWTRGCVARCWRSGCTRARRCVPCWTARPRPRTCACWPAWSASRSASRMLCCGRAGAHSSDTPSSTELIRSLRRFAVRCRRRATFPHRLRWTTPPLAVPLRLLYLNRLQRLKGIEELVTAVRSLPDEDLTLTVVGRDTMTGPDQTSMRAHIESLVGDDPRIVLCDQVPHAEVPELIARHHAVVVPSHWEAGAYVVREALGSNRPVIATPVGAIPEAVRPGESGWLARSGAPDDLAAALREALGARELILEMVKDGRPRAVFDELAGGEAVLRRVPRVARALRRGAARRGPRRRRSVERGSAHRLRGRRGRPTPHSDLAGRRVRRVGALGAHRGAIGHVTRPGRSAHTGGRAGRNAGERLAASAGMGGRACPHHQRAHPADACGCGSRARLSATSR